MGERLMGDKLMGCQNCKDSPCTDCLQSDFAETPHFSSLKENPPRFNLFKWDNEAKFRQFMGDDVNPVEHGRHQAEKVAIPFIEAQARSGGHQSFTDREAKILVITNVVHDWHEGITGDVPLTSKTVASDIAELEINHSLLKELIDEDLADSIRDIMGDFEGETFVGRAFKAVEYCGYLQTGEKAWGLRNSPALTPEEQGRCYSMGTEVRANCVPKLETYRDEFAYVDSLLGSLEC